MKAIAIMMRPEVQARTAAVYQLRAGEPRRLRDRADLQGAGGPALPTRPRTSARAFANVDWWVKNSDEMVKRFDAFAQK